MGSYNFPQNQENMQIIISAESKKNENLNNPTVH